MRFNLFLYICINQQPIQLERIQYESVRGQFESKFLKEWAKSAIYMCYVSTDINFKFQHFVLSYYGNK